MSHPILIRVGKQNMSFKSYFSLLPLEHNRLTKHGKSLSWPCLATRGKKNKNQDMSGCEYLRSVLQWAAMIKWQQKSASTNLMEWLNTWPSKIPFRWPVSNVRSMTLLHTLYYMHVHCRVIVLHNLTMFMMWGYIITIQSPAATNLVWTTKADITGEFHILYSAMLIWGTSKLLGRVVQSWVKITQV